MSTAFVGGLEGSGVDKKRVMQRPTNMLPDSRPDELAPMEEWDLVSLARYFGTDKWGAHRYAPHYEHHFGRFKYDDFTLFEIGIGGYSREKLGGASLRMWKAFFPKAQIIGLDPRGQIIRSRATDRNLPRQPDQCTALAHHREQRQEPAGGSR